MHSVGNDDYKLAFSAKEKAGKTATESAIFVGFFFGVRRNRYFLTVDVVCLRFESSLWNNAVVYTYNH